MRFHTPAQRNASFSPYHQAKIGQERVGDYLIDRSGFLLDGGRVDLMTNSPGNRFHYKDAGFGTAAAIDPRGYFLTAAHCVEKKECWLVWRDGKTQSERARIVWRGNEKKGGPDLAILCVARPLTHTFAWAAEFTNGSPVMDVGVRWNEEMRDVTPQCMAGSVLKAEPLSTNAWAYSVVSHSSPLRPGDSGGPLVLSDGRLVGINVSVEYDFQWSRLSLAPRHSTAHRPDLAWVRKVIEADAALQGMSGPKQGAVANPP
jgi:hypothetical protein